MNPTTASMLADARHAELLREAAAYRRARRLRSTSPPRPRRTRHPRLRTALRLTFVADTTRS